MRSFRSALDEPPARRRRRKPVDHVFLGFSEIAGYYGELAEGFREAGARVTMLSIRAHRFGYALPRDQPRLVTFANRCTAERQGQASKARRFASALVAGAAQIAAFVQALSSCQGFVVGWPTSALHRWVFHLLRLLGKSTVVVFHGSDHRPPFCDGGYSRTSGIELADEAARRRRQVRAAERVGAVVANPLSAQFHSKPFIRFQTVGVPTSAAGPAGARSEDPTVRVLHAPSDTGVKGSHLIRLIVAEIQESGDRVEYVELTNVPHERVEQVLQRCHLVVDQCWSDTTMAGLAATAARLGVASVAGSHGAGLLDRLVPASGRPPTVCVSPEDLAGTVKSLVRDPTSLRDIGDAARRFVTTEWRRDEVARRFLAVLNGETPPEWLCQPEELVYVWGCGLEQDQVRQRVVAVLEVRGAGGLALDHAPALRDAFLALAGRP